MRYILLWFIAYLQDHPVSRPILQPSLSPSSKSFDQATLTSVFPKVYFPIDTSNSSECFLIFFFFFDNISNIVVAESTVYVSSQSMYFLRLRFNFLKNHYPRGILPGYPTTITTDQSNAGRQFRLSIGFLAQFHILKLSQKTAETLSLWFLYRGNYEINVEISKNDSNNFCSFFSEIRLPQFRFSTLSIFLLRYPYPISRYQPKILYIFSFRLLRTFFRIKNADLMDVSISLLISRLVLTRFFFYTFLP